MGILKMISVLLAIAGVGALAAADSKRGGRQHTLRSGESSGSAPLQVESTVGGDRLGKLPPDIQKEICGHLDGNSRTLGDLRRTSKYLKFACNDAFEATKKDEGELLQRTRGDYDIGRRIYQGTGRIRFKRVYEPGAILDLDNYILTPKDGTILGNLLMGHHHGDDGQAKNTVLYTAISMSLSFNPLLGDKGLEALLDALNDDELQLPLLRRIVAIDIGITDEGLQKLVDWTMKHAPQVTLLNVGNVNPGMVDTGDTGAAVGLNLAHGATPATSGLPPAVTSLDVTTLNKEKLPEGETKFPPFRILTGPCKKEYFHIW